MITEKELHEIADKGFIQDIEDENERRIKRGETPIDIDYVKVWHYAQEEIDNDHMPAVSRYVTKNPDGAAKWILSILKKSNSPIDRKNVGSVMAMLDSDLDHGQFDDHSHLKLTEEEEREIEEPDDRMYAEFEKAGLVEEIDPDDEK